jgi:hypothetical protein
MHWLDRLFVQENAAGTATDGVPIAQSPEGVEKNRSNLNMKRKAGDVVHGDLDDDSHQSGEETLESIQRKRRRYDVIDTGNEAPYIQPSRPSKIIVLRVPKATFSPTVAEGLVGVDSQVVQRPEVAKKQDNGAKKRGIDYIADDLENNPPNAKRTRRNVTKAGDMASNDPAASLEDVVNRLGKVNAPLIQRVKAKQRQEKKAKKPNAKALDSDPSAIAGAEDEVSRR